MTRLVQAHADAFPDPNTNFRYAACCLLNSPIIDRTGTIVDPDVRLAIPKQSSRDIIWSRHIKYRFVTS